METDPLTTDNMEQLAKKLERVQRDFSILYDISNAMRTTLELNHILYIILTGVTSHAGLGFNRAILFLSNSDNTHLEPQMAIGPRSGEDAQQIWSHIVAAGEHLEDLIKKDNLAEHSQQLSFFKTIRDIRIPINATGEQLLSKIFLSGNAKILSENEIKEYPNDVFFQRFKTTEMAVVPLKIKDKSIGLIAADNIFTQRRPSEDDLRMFMTLANQAALAIENSRLYEIVKQRSHTDPITSLWNHGFFQAKISALIEEFKQSHSDLSLIILDIDNFKMLNDSFGHQIGDTVLKEIARLLKESSREIDFVCRYGGEEFSVILPYTNKRHAHTIAERIRHKIEEHHFNVGENLPLHLTVSLGVATLRDDGNNKEELIDAADQAMYRAKKAGKNQTAVP